MRAQLAAPLPSPTARPFPPGVVSRPRLLEALVPTDASRVLALVAPPGYGKTTLVLEHAHRHEGPAVWVDLGPGDDDPVVLVSKLATAIGEMGRFPELHKAIRKPGPSPWERLIPRVGEALATRPDWLLVFDDVHEVTALEALDVLAWLALHVPEGRQVVLMGRSVEGLPLARLRLTGHLREIDAAALAFTDDEAEELLVEAGVDVSTSIRLNRQCEGWAAGLRMAVLAGAGDAPMPGALPAGPGKYVAEYVRSELLSRLAPIDADFLIQTSVLRRLHPELCDTVLERSGSGEVLRRLAHRGAFITVLDEREGWYQCHELVRDALMSELADREPFRARRSRHRAAVWHASHGLPEDAVRYEQESGSRKAALAMIGRHAQMEFGQGRTNTVFEWLDWAESEQLMTGDVDVALSGMIGLAISGQADRAARWADALQASAAARHGWAALGRALSPRHGPAQAVADAREAAEHVPASSRWRRVTLLALGLALLVDDQEAAAEDALLRVAVPGRNVPEAPNAEAIALDLRASLAIRRGDLATARALQEDAGRVRERGAITEQGPQALHDAVVALVAVADGDRPRARERIAHAQRLRPLLTWVIPGLAIATRIELIRGYLAMPDPAAARTLLLEVNDILRRCPDLGRFKREADGLRDQLGFARGTLSASTLTAAELRIIPLLATHLTFSEIGYRLQVSGNTAKTHALSAYRKLDATSRSEAVANAVRAGILDPAAVVLILRSMESGPHPE